MYNRKWQGFETWLVSGAFHHLTHLELERNKRQLFEQLVGYWHTTAYEVVDVIRDSCNRVLAYLARPLLDREMVEAELGASLEPKVPLPLAIRPTRVMRGSIINCS